jgi:20S proteasome subunit beta 3
MVGKDCVAIACDLRLGLQAFRYKHNMYRLREERDISPQTFANLVSSSLYERRFGPWFVSPVVAGINGTTGKPFICGYAHQYTRTKMHTD